MGLTTTPGIVYRAIPQVRVDIFYISPRAQSFLNLLCFCKSIQLETEAESTLTVNILQIYPRQSYSVENVYVSL